MTARIFVSFFIFLFSCFQAQVSNSMNLTCNPKDLIALEGFLKGLDSDTVRWGDHKYSSDCCHWIGVNCELSSLLGLNDFSVSGKRVVQLDLGRSQLKGVVSHSLAGLDQLRVLNLSTNFLTGILPLNLFQLHHLKVLDLSGNNFNGSIPSMTNLPSIQVFNISANLFTGSQPLLGGSLNLTSFVAGNNLFSGSISTSICNSSSHIQALDLSSNCFSGNIPNGFGDCKFLTDLLLNSNSLAGNLPDDLFELPLLEQLHLQENQLSGPLPQKVQTLWNLVQFDISNNGFTGIIPEIFANLTNLEYFSARSNNFVGALPSSLSLASTLRHLDLRNNSLYGRINLNCTLLVRLNFLDLGLNQFIGPIPRSLSLCAVLEVMNLDGNKLEGLIPGNFKNLQTLSHLSLSGNSFRNISKTLEILQQCDGLTTLVLAANFLGEEMPVPGIQGFKNLKVLSIPNCNLSGPIPTWLSNCTALKVLDLSRNSLSGTIPSFIGDLFNLNYLDLSYNSLSGEIPINLFAANENQIEFDSTKVSIPVTIPNQETEDLLYNQFFDLPPSIDLSNNQLTGPIPPEFGNLKELRILDLSWNKLSGTINRNLSGMRLLELLDLSNNNFTGSIPNSLTELSFLSWFNVANNHLEGKLPTEGQFSTFPTLSFKGNARLCGDYFQPCDQHQVPSGSTTPGDEVEESGITFRWAFLSGAATSFVLTVITCFSVGIPPLRGNAYSKFFLPHAGSRNT